MIALEEADGRRKIYKLTSAGREALRQEYLRLKAMVADGKTLVEEETMAKKNAESGGSMLTKLRKPRLG